MGYGYMSKSGVLHIVSDRKTAEENSLNGKIIETSVPNEGGYPVVPTGNGNTSSLVVYREGNAYVNGNERDGNQVSLSNYPEVNDLYHAVV